MDVPATLHYEVVCADLAAHVINVSLQLRGLTASTLQLALPNWIPGSYKIRDYARHMLDLQATAPDAGTLPLVQTSKSSWEVVLPAGCKDVTLTYVLYGCELSARTNFISEDFVLLHGAPTFLYVEGYQQLPVTLTLRQPANWPPPAVPLPARGAAAGKKSTEGDGQAYDFYAETYDALADTPLLLGEREELAFACGATSYRLVSGGGPFPFAKQRVVDDLQRACATVQAFWGQVPFSEYLFIHIAGGQRGGLEHRSSTVVFSGSVVADDEEDYLDWLSLLVHGLFHAWNGKRLRPQALGPFDYGKENYTRSLWVVEGITSYYEKILLVRAGLLRPEQYLTQLAKLIDAYEQTPGRLVQSLTDCSYAAWIKYYQRDAWSPNYTISYYLKGALVAFCLDVQLRAASGNAVSLDDVLRAAYARYSGARGYSEEDFRALVAQLSGAAHWQSWLAAACDSVSPLPLPAALAQLNLVREVGAAAPASEASSTPLERRLGLTLRAEGRGLRVAQILHNSPAFAAGLQVEDLLLAVNGRPASVASQREALRRCAPGAALYVQAERFGRQRSVLVWVPQPQRDTQLRPDPRAQAAPLSLQAWLAPAPPTTELSSSLRSEHCG